MKISASENGQRRPVFVPYSSTIARLQDSRRRPWRPVPSFPRVPSATWSVVSIARRAMIRSNCCPAPCPCLHSSMPCCKLLLAQKWPLLLLLLRALLHLVCPFLLPDLSGVRRNVPMPWPCCDAARP